MQDGLLYKGIVTVRATELHRFDQTDGRIGDEAGSTRRIARCGMQHVGVNEEDVTDLARDFFEYVTVFNLGVETNFPGV